MLTVNSFVVTMQQISPASGLQHGRSSTDARSFLLEGLLDGGKDTS